MLQKIPESQYDFIMKSLLTSNDYVFSLASLQLNCFNEKCTSHLVASENENLGSYSSKTISYMGGDAKQSQGNLKANFELWNNEKDKSFQHVSGLNSLGF